MRTIAYLLIYLGVPALALILNHPIVSTVLAIAYILLLIPIGLLRMIDFYRANDGTTKISRIFNLIFRVPLALLGFICLAAGITLIGWVLYNVFVKRQKEYSGPSFILGLGSFGIGPALVLYGCCTLRSVLRRKGQSVLSPPEQEQFEDEESNGDPQRARTIPR